MCCSVDIHLCYSPFLAIMNNAAINICVHVFVWTYVFHSIKYIPRSGIAGSCGNSMFNIPRNCQTVFHSGCTILHSHQQCTRVSVSPHPRQHLLFPIFVFFLHFPGNLHLQETCIYLMANHAEHLFMCLLALYISSLDK